MDNKEFIKDLLTRKLDKVIEASVIAPPRAPADGELDSYYAMQAAKKKAKEDGKVWDKMGQDEKDRYSDAEMKKAGYEKKPGNTKYTRISNKKDDEPKKSGPDLSSPEKRIKHFGDNPTASMAGSGVTDDEAKQIQLIRMEKQLEELLKKAEKAQEKMYDADEAGDDEAYEDAQEEEEYWYEKIQSLENRIEDLKDEMDSKREETMKSFKEFKNISEAFSLTKGNFTQVKSLEKLLNELVKFAKKAGHKNFMVPPGSGADHQNKRDVSKPKGFYSPTLMSLIEGLYYTVSDSEEKEWADKSDWSNKMSKTFPDKRYGGLDSEDAYDKDYGSIKGMRAQIFMAMTDFFEANPDFMGKFGSPEKATRMFIR